MGLVCRDDPYCSYFQLFWCKLIKPNRLLQEIFRVPQSKRKRRRGGQPGRKPLKMSEIPVVDPRGDRAKVLVRELRLEPGSPVERKQFPTN
jgi:hypothetical protein